MKVTQRASVTWLVALLPAAACGLGGCQKTVEPRPPARPAPTYSGPDFLHTTIASVSVVRGYQPMLVSGYGLVVGLDGTGSPDCPPQLRQWLINEMARKGFGSESMGYGQLTPSQVLASDQTAVVLVEAVIPPGAVSGTPIDARVEALPQTQTTSLAGGRLYTTELRIGGKFIGRPSSRPYAEARGDIFVNPFVSDSSGLIEPSPRPADPRQGRLVGGAVVRVDASLALQLNQKSFTRSRQVADRINGRFPQRPEDPEPLAVAKNDESIALNVLNRFRGNPRRMLELINGLYLNPTDSFNRTRARDLIKVLADPNNHKHASRIALVWEGMGKQVLPEIRSAYTHESMVVRMAALEAGARLGDIQAEQPLTAIATSSDSAAADRATALLGELLDEYPSNFRIAVTLRNLLNANDALVRLAAFDGLARVDDPAIIRRQFDERFELALVDSSRPMIYVTRTRKPRIVIFDQMLSFDRPTLFTHDDNRLMLRLDDDEDMASVYYRPPGATNGRTEQFAPAVANFIVLLGRRPTREDPYPGYEMTYSQIVQILHRLTRERHIAAPLVLEPSDLMQRIARHRIEELPEQRPETGANAVRPERAPADP